MRRRFTRLLVAAAVTLASVWSAPALAGGQGAAAASRPYTPPRTPDGHPDIQGIWQVLSTADWDIQDHAGAYGVPAGTGVVVGNEIPYQPWALAQKQKNYASRLTAEQNTTCFMPGVPRITYKPHPFQIFQTRDYTAIFYEFGHVQRFLYYGGEHIDFPRWMGDSRAKWEGDTLVADVAWFNDKTWFDRAGNFHSDALHVVERYTRTGPAHMRYVATVEDPKRA